VIILDNAVKYSSKKRAIFINSKKDKKNIHLSIKDQGIGIDKKSLPHIFNRFYRADEARTKNGRDGYGLGLSIAKKIVSVHQGEIKMESKVGGGTTVTISLPVFS